MAFVLVLAVLLPVQGGRECSGMGWLEAPAEIEL